MRVLRDRMKKVLFYTASNVASVVQFGGIGALEGSQDADRGVQDELQGAARSLLRRDSRGTPGTSSPARRRAARSTRSCASIPTWVSAGRLARHLDSWAMTEFLILKGTDRLCAGRGLRRERRRLPALLFRAGSQGTDRRARLDEDAFRLTERRRQFARTLVDQAFGSSSRQFEVLAQGCRGAPERKVADVEMPRPDRRQRADRSRADLLGVAPSANSCFSSSTGTGRKLLRAASVRGFAER